MFDPRYLVRGNDLFIQGLSEEECKARHPASRDLLLETSDVAVYTANVAR